MKNNGATWLRYSSFIHIGFCQLSTVNYHITLVVRLFKKPFPYWNNLNSAMLIVDDFLFIISQNQSPFTRQTIWQSWGRRYILFNELANF